MELYTAKKKKTGIGCSALEGRPVIGRFRYPLRDPFSAVLVNVGGGRIQRPLHHTGLREPTRGRRERKEKVVM